MMMMSPMCAEEVNNKNPNIPECPGTQSDMWRNSADVALDHFECAHFGQISAIFAIFQSLWRRSEAPEEPKFLVKVHSTSKGSTRNFTEV